MSLSAGNQTISYLARRFAEAGIRPHARHGQNFLVDLNLQRLIVERPSSNRGDVVLEVGTGTGVARRRSWRRSRPRSSRWKSIRSFTSLPAKSCSGWRTW